MTEYKMHKCKYADKYKAKRAPKCGCETCAKKWKEKEFNKEFDRWLAKKSEIVSNILKRVLAYENSDGFLTKDEQVFKKREVLLKKLEKMDSHWKYYSKEERALQFWSSSKEERKKQLQLLTLLNNDRKNACKSCNGSCRGHDWEDEYGKSHETECADCHGTGLTEKYRNETGREKFADGTWDLFIDGIKL